MKRFYTILCMYFAIVLSLAAVSPMFNGDSACAEEASICSFGSGKTIVRIYTDYFCGPCRNLEPRIENIISRLIEKNIITGTFIDVPFHKYSGMYTRYYLYILNKKRGTIRHVMKARHILTEAAKGNIVDAGKLESFLLQKGIEFKIYDPMATLKTFERFMREDRINATPSMVVITDNKKHLYKGTAEIINALNGLVEPLPKS